MKTKILLLDENSNGVKDLYFSRFDNNNYEIICINRPGLINTDLLNTVDIIFLSSSFKKNGPVDELFMCLIKKRKRSHIHLFILDKEDYDPGDTRPLKKKFKKYELISKDTDPQIVKLKVDSVINSKKFRKKGEKESFLGEFREVFKTWKHIVFKLISKRIRLFLFFSIFLMLIAGMLTNVPAIILGYLVDYIIADKVAVFSHSVPYILLIIAAILLKEGITVFRKYLAENSCTRIAKEQKVDLIAHLLKVDLKELRGMMAGSLQGRITRSLDGLIRLLKLAFLDFFPVFFTAAAALMFAFLKSWIIGLIMILVIPTGFLLILWQVSSQKGIRIDLLRANESIDGKVVELLSCLESVRALNTVSKEVAKIDEKTEFLRVKEIKHHVSMAFFDSIKKINEGFFYILVIVVSLYMSFKGMISKGDILTYSILYLSVMNPLREMHRILDEAHESYLKTKDLLELKLLKKDISFNTKPVRPLTQKSQNTLEIKNLSFSYNGNNGSNGNTINDVSCNILKNNRIGIAGPTGCGKSTFIKLFLRLLHYEQGEISLNEVPLKNFSREDISKIFGYVQQKPLIVSGTILDNITYGYRNNFSFEEVVDAAKKANIHDEIVNELGGYYGDVQEGGKNLSGGQVQRIALSRLFLYKPPILILDEATSALDNITEKEVQKNLETHLKESTIIQIAHRLSTLRNCDQIFVFDQNKIVETGTYSQLLSQKGLFSQLHKASELQIN